MNLSLADMHKMFMAEVLTLCAERGASVSKTAEKHGPFNDWLKAKGYSKATNRPVAVFNTTEEALDALVRVSLMSTLKSVAAKKLVVEKDEAELLALASELLIEEEDGFFG